MFASLNDETRLRPAGTGLAVVGAVVLAIASEPYVILRGLEYRFDQPGPPFAMKLITPELIRRPAAQPHGKTGPQAAKPSRTALTALAGSAGATRRAESALGARPGTASWNAHAERGQHLTLQIFATGSLPVLRAHGVRLALDTRRPRAMSSIFDLATAQLSWGPVPDGIVVRELDEMPPTVGFAEAFEAKRREAGGPVTIYALYPAELYAVLRSLVYEALEQEGVAPETVRRASVELWSTGGRSFVVRLTGHS